MQAPPDVAPGWKVVFNEQHQQWFYVNEKTQVSTWQKPSEPRAVTSEAFAPPTLNNGLSNGETLPSDNQQQLNQRHQQSLQGYYGGNPFDDDLPEVDNSQSGADLEDEILKEYSFAQGEGVAGFKSPAWSLKRNCKVMIKRYSKSNETEIAKANREIRALMAVSDPAVPSLIDYFDPADVIFVVIGDREDESLKRYIEGRGSLSEDVLKSMILQLFSAVAQVFNTGFAHMRICDETVFIDHQNSQLTLKDFEYAVEYGKEKVDDLYAATDAKFGSGIYVAPEIYASTTYNARKAVIWSCGVVSYYMTTGQTDRLSNLEHPVFETTSNQSAVPTVNDGQPSPNRRRSSLGFRRQSLGGRKASISTPPNMITYPGSRFELPHWIRDIISKMLIVNPARRAELIEVAAKVPKEFHSKVTRPLMEISWLDYKDHVGPYAGLNEQFELPSSASSMYSGISNFSNPFASLMGNRRSSRGFV